MEAAYAIDIDIDDAFAGLVDAEALAAAVRETLRQVGPATAGLTVAITDDDEVRELNRSYRGVDAATDVLSFASHNTTAMDGPEIVLPPELEEKMAAYLGDIVIAYPYSAAQAGQHATPVATELRLLAVHGTLHLLGYDHDTPVAEQRMWAAQDAVLAVFGERSPTQRTYDT